MNRMRSAASCRSKSAQTMAGAWPPSSSVTGVRFCAAAAITARPVVPEPVNRRWSNGSLENSMPTPPVSSKNCNCSGGKYSGMRSISSAARWREFSLILTMARLPAAST